MANLESMLQFLESTFDVSSFPDYPHALNGLQVTGPPEVNRIVAAVDASEQAIGEAVETGAQLLLVHHGLFWDGFGPITGPRFRKVAALIKGEMALYALHLPLDAHPTFGNCSLLTESLGLNPEGTFHSFKGVDIGVWASAGMGRDELKERLKGAVAGEVRVIPGSGGEVKRVGVLTGGGAGALREAAAMGLDALITGEAAHHHYHEARELGLDLFLAGHYATETFGVKALAAYLAEEFSVEWSFLQLPTGM